MVHVLTDSTSDISQEDAASSGVTVVPLTVRFGEEQFRDGVDLTPADFYRRLRVSESNPATSQPSPEDFAAAYRQCLEADNDSVVGIHISQKLSGTLQAAQLAAHDFPDGRIHLVDSQTVSGGLQFLVRAALADARQGISAAEVAERARARAGRVGVYILFDTLTYLHRGGRIGKAQSFVGGLLNVKPIARIVNGEVEPQARVRSRRQGLDSLVDLLKSRGSLEAVAVMHADAPDSAGLRDRVASLFPDLEVTRGAIGPVVGTYAGPGTVGIAFMEAG